MGGTDQARATRRSPATPDDTEGGGVTRNPPPDAVINLDQEGAPSGIFRPSIMHYSSGDPTMYEPFWRKLGDKCTIVIKGYEHLSYFSGNKNPCWFLEPKLEDSIRSLHGAVGNAETDGYTIVVGTGSSQLLQSVLYAVSPPDQSNPINVVSAAPFYSCYPETTDIVRSGVYKWAGDAHGFDKDEPYIEFVTSPNNPNGVIRGPVVNRDGGIVVHDLAYYWPQYTPITSSLDFDIMLFTASKCTGHAGSRIGWALVKDKEIAKRMIGFMTVTSIGVSKESQLRVAKILQVVADGCKRFGSPEGDNLFEFGRNMMAKRWEILRETVKKTQMFTLPKYPFQHCNYFGDLTQAHPGFAWIKCNDGMKECEEVFKGSKILVRSGRRFGSDPGYARVSIMSKDDEFNGFIDRLSSMIQIHSNVGNLD